MNIAIPFPEEQPNGYQWLSEEPMFDQAKHLALESPSQSLSLEDLGYTSEETRDLSLIHI